MNYTSRIPVRKLTLSEIPSVRSMLKSLGMPYKIIYTGPRPAADHNGCKNASSTLKKNATGARLYVTVKMKQMPGTTWSYPSF